MGERIEGILREAMKTVDTFLDKDGRVVDAKDGVTMRRVVLNDAGEVVETSIWYAKGKSEEAAK